MPLNNNRRELLFLIVTHTRRGNIFSNQNKILIYNKNVRNFSFKFFITTSYFKYASSPPHHHHHHTPDMNFIYCESSTTMEIN
jgi:hypothetical protein